MSGHNDEAICPLMDEARGLATEQVGHNVWSWTLTSRLSELIASAEASFGQRDRAYTLLGVEFGGDRPCTWFPGDRGHVSIRLTNSALKVPSHAYYQLAHETVHLLAPRPSVIACNFEEGLAVHFSDRECAKLGISFHLDIEAYVKPRDYVSEILQQNPDVVRTARQARPAMFDWTGDFLAQYTTALPAENLDWLCQPFVG